MNAAPKVAAAAGSAVAPGFAVDTGGAAAMWSRFNEIGKVDLERAERISLPLSLLALLVAFGSVVAAGLPIMLALAGLAVARGGLYFLAGVTDLNIFVTNTSIIGIGVGIDYALFIVTRFREELRGGQPTDRAVPWAMASAGRAVALSGATVIVALAGMVLVDIQAGRSMAVGAMLAVALVVLAALTLLPAVLALLGPRVGPPASAAVGGSAETATGSGTDGRRRSCAGHGRSCSQAGCAGGAERSGGGDPAGPGRGGLYAARGRATRGGRAACRRVRGGGGRPHRDRR